MPPSEAEPIVAAYLSGQGIEVHKGGGWPDFLCEDSQGRVFAVEVKKTGWDKVRDNQNRVHNLLRKADVPVAVIWVHEGELVSVDWGPEYRRMLDHQLAEKLDIVHELTEVA